MLHIEENAILKSLSDIYYSMHVVSLTDDTVYEYTARNEVKDIVKHHKGAVETMHDVMIETIADEFLEYALEFSDLTTLAARMQNKKSTYADLLGKHVGWIRLNFIAMEADAGGYPTTVICTTQVIDEEKRKEEVLLKQSTMDGLTGCLNRKAYEDDLAMLPACPSEEEFVYISMDINGLKVVNDNLGHEAGDELIIGAADCMKRCLGNYGRLYRVGGDEFVAIIYADPNKLADILDDFDEELLKWHGELVDEVAVSYGYASKREFLHETVSELARIADKRMYDAKNEYYKRTGADRRGQIAAYSVLSALYTKILKINITDDTYQIISMNSAEQTAEKGFAGTISAWLQSFGTSGQVHPEDLETYLKKTDLSYMQEWFAAGNEVSAVSYRRRFGDVYQQAVMEMIRANDYSDRQQKLFLYVKKY